MEIKFTDAQLKTLSDNGITMDDLRSSVSTYREQGYSDEDIQRGLWGTIKKINPHVLNPIELEDKMKRTWPRRVQEMERLGLQVPDYDENVSYTQRQKETYNMLQEEYDKRREASDRKIRNLERAGAATAAFGSAYTLGMSDLMMAGIDAVTGNNLVQQSKEWQAGHPGYAIGGGLAGFISPGSAMKAGMKWVNGLANKSQASIVKGATALAEHAPSGANAIVKTGKIAGWGTKVLENALGAQALFQIQDTAKKLAETGEFESQDKALEELSDGTMLNAGVDIAMQAVGGVASKVYDVFSKTQKAVKVAGGLENINRGKIAAQAVKDAGGSTEDVAAAFYGTVAEGLGRKEKVLFENLLANDEEFARIMQQQAADSKQVVVNTIDSLTKPEYAKLSRATLENAWGTSKNQLGKYEVDFTKKGLDQLLGLDDGGRVLELRKEALARAEKKVMQNQSLARDVKVNFDELSARLKNKGSQDLERAYKTVEPGSIKSFEGSVEQTEAIQRAQQRIASTEKALGRPLESGEIEKIMNEEARAGAERHFRNIMAEGTDSVQDINNIKDFFDKEFAAEVKEGKAEAIGAFTEGINTQILDNLDDVLYQSNQAMRLGKTLGKIHDFGKKYTDANFNELESLLNNGTSAKEKAMKLAVFKMGMLDNITEQAVAGNPTALDQMRSLMSRGKLKPYFTTEEIGSYIDMIKPKAEAARTLNGILKTAYMLRGENPDILAPTIRAGVSGAVMHAPNIFMNSLVTIASRISPYGPNTAKMLQRLAEKPDWRTFNNLVKGVTDPAEKNMLRQSITMAVENVIHQTGQKE